MVLQNYQKLIEITSNMIYIVALGVGLKCSRKIHLNTQCRDGARSENLGGRVIRGGQKSGGGHCVFKWILRGHLKPTPSATI